MCFVIWDTMGEIFHRCDSEEDFEVVMEECGYEELGRTHNGRETNVCVID